MADHRSDAVIVHEAMRQEMERAQEKWEEGEMEEWDANRKRIDRRYLDYLKAERDYRAALPGIGREQAYVDYYKALRDAAPHGSEARTGYGDELAKAEANVRSQLTGSRETWHMSETASEYWLNDDPGLHEEKDGKVKLLDSSDFTAGSREYLVRDVYRELAPLVALNENGLPVHKYEGGRPWQNLNTAFLGTSGVGKSVFGQYAVVRAAAMHNQLVRKGEPDYDNEVVVLHISKNATCTLFDAGGRGVYSGEGFEDSRFGDVKERIREKKPVIFLLDGIGPYSKGVVGKMPNSSVSNALSIVMVSSTSVTRAHYKQWIKETVTEKSRGFQPMVIPPWPKDEVRKLATLQTRYTEEALLDRFHVLGGCARLLLADNDLSELEESVALDISQLTHAEMSMLTSDGASKDDKAALVHIRKRRDVYLPQTAAEKTAAGTAAAYLFAVAPATPASDYVIEQIIKAITERGEEQLKLFLNSPDAVVRDVFKYAFEREVHRTLAAGVRDLPLLRLREGGSPTESGQTFSVPAGDPFVLTDIAEIKPDLVGKYGKPERDNFPTVDAVYVREACGEGEVPALDLLQMTVSTSHSVKAHRLPLATRSSPPASFAAAAGAAAAAAAGTNVGPERKEDTEDASMASAKSFQQLPSVSAGGLPRKRPRTREAGEPAAKRPALGAPTGPTDRLIFVVPESQSHKWTRCSLTGADGRVVSGVRGSKYAYQCSIPQFVLPIKWQTELGKLLETYQTRE